MRLRAGRRFPLGLDAQRSAAEAYVKEHGGEIIGEYQEVETGKDSKRPEIMKAIMHANRSWATLVIAKLDRLARNVWFTSTLMESGIDFVACDNPQASRLTLHILASVAEEETRLISERTKAGIKAAKARGKLPGNPGLREHRSDAIRTIAAARNQVYVGDLISSAPTWLPTVQRMRPQHSWGDVIRVLNHKGQRWTVERLRRSVRRLVRERLAAPELITRAPRRPPEDRLMTLVAGIAIAGPELTLREIAAQLERMRERTPRGGHQWAASSVKHLLDRARRRGRVVPEPLDA